MPGTLIHDALAPNLATGVADPLITTTTSTVITTNRPGQGRVKLTTGTVTSRLDSATLSVEIQGSDSATFASGNVSYGRFAALSGRDALQSSLTRYLAVRVYKTYMRAIYTVGGRLPSYARVTCKLEEPHYLRTGTDTA